MHTNLQEGCEIYTADGDKVGTVKEVRGDSFKVDAKMQMDYWLACSNITSTDSDRVVLGFSKDRLGDFKMDMPAMASDTGFTEPIGGASDPGFPTGAGSTTTQESGHR